MFQNLAILGNSHTTCLKLAYNDDPGLLGDLTPIFFAAGGARMENLEILDGKLVANNAELKYELMRTSGGLTSIAPADYDLFLLIGLRLFVPPLTQATYSKALLDVYFYTVARESVAWKLAINLRSLTDAPIYCGPSPLYATPQEKFVDRYGEAVMAYDDVLARLQLEFNEIGVTLVQQPKETLYGPFTTDRKFMALEAGYFEKDGKRIRDWGHMNPAYGRIYLQTFYEQIQAPKVTNKPPRG